MLMGKEKDITSVILILCIPHGVFLVLCCTGWKGLLVVGAAAKVDGAAFGV